MHLLIYRPKLGFSLLVDLYWSWAYEKGVKSISIWAFVIPAPVSSIRNFIFGHPASSLIFLALILIFPRSVYLMETDNILISIFWNLVISVRIFSGRPVVQSYLHVIHVSFSFASYLKRFIESSSTETTLKNEWWKIIELDSSCE